VNGKIRAREVRIVGTDGKQLGILSLGDALNMARAAGVDLVEIAPNATPPVCRLVDFGKYRYELAKRDKESKKHQHANKVKEVQLSPKIDPHDLGVKVGHAIDFLCEDMKVKVTLKFRGREMAHTEFGFEVVKKFLAEIAPYGHPDAPPKLMGRGLNVMISPLPRNKRAKHPNPRNSEEQNAPEESEPFKPGVVQVERGGSQESPSSTSQGSFTNNPFEQLEVNR
jgi:translation initiation factor IF-3